MFLKKSVRLKPVMFTEVAIIVLLAGVGTALALNSTGALKQDGNYEVELAQGTVSDAKYVSAADYSLVYDNDASHLHSVRVILTNSSSSEQRVNVTVKVGDNTMTTTAEKTNSGVVVPANGKVETVTLDSDFALSDLQRIHIYIEEIA